MVGSWLFAPDQEDSNQIIDPGAQELPRVNQALRGVTMPILFGTNRVSSNMVWQNNFQTIRHESQESSGGGGKGGGSGLGGKGGAKGATSVNYEYKIDLLYHFGMVSEDFNLFGGWVGPERMNDDTLVAITQGGAGAVNFFRSDVDRPQTASLAFEEGFFHPGFATGDVQGENWDYFESVELHPHRFPYTAYIGYKALNLGGAASIPQLSFEIGPGEVEFTFNSNHLTIFASATTTSATGGSGPAPVIIGDDGKRYMWDNAGGNTVGMLRNIFSGTTVDTKTDTEFDTDATNLGLDPTASYSFTSSNTSGVIAGTNYIFASGQDVGSGTRSNIAIIIYKVDSAGALVTVGGYQGRTENLDFLKENPVLAINGEGTDDDYILAMASSQVGADHEYFLFKIPSINEMIAIKLEDTASANFEDRTHSLRTAVTEIKTNFGTHESHRDFDHDKFGFFLPTVTVSAGLPTWAMKAMFYIGKSDIEWHNDNPADANGTDTIYDITGTYPNGGIFSVRIADGASDQALIITNEFVDEAANFIDHTTKEAVVPFADSGRLYNESTIQDGSDYDPIPQVQNLTGSNVAGATLLCFWKNLAASSSDRDPTGADTQVQVFLWNPVKQQAERYAKINGSIADAVADWGANGDAYTISAISGFYQESTNELLVAGYVNGDGLSHEIFLGKFGDFDIGGGDDVLPPFIIHEILTSDVFGIGIDPANIDQSSYELALQYCDAEDIRVSAIYNREQGALQHIELLLAVYGGFLTESGGKIKFGISDLSTGVVRTLDNTHFVVDEGEPPVTVTRGARQETYNKVKVNYLDRALEYRQNFIEINDEVDQDLNGIRAREFPPKFVMTEQTANKIGIRTLWSNLYAKDIYTFALGPKDADLEPGDPVTLVDSFHPDPELSGAGVRARITQWDERDPYKFNVRAIKEVEYINVATYEPSSATAATFNQLFGPARAPADFRMYELPQEFQGANPTLFVGYNQLSPAMGARLYLSADGVSFAKADEIQPFIISGIFADALPDREPGWVEENVQVYLMPDTRSTDTQVGFSAASPTFVQTIALDDVGADGRALGAGNIYIGSEMVAYQGVNLLGQNHYSFDKLYRGWGGTNIHDHSSGAYWHKHAGGVFTRTYNEDKIGTMIHYKVTPFNFNGVEFDVSSIDARTHQIGGLFFKPQVQPPIRTFVESLITGTASDNLGALELKHVHSAGTAVTLTWPDAARVKGYGAAGYGTGTYGRFVTDTTSHNWRVEVLSSDESTVVRCVTVDSGFFVYSANTNSTDFNGWQGAFSVRVTPFNDIGDAARNRTKKLRLFEQV
jgi:hypothetical protein